MASVHDRSPGTGEVNQRYSIDTEHSCVGRPSGSVRSVAAVSTLGAHSDERKQGDQALECLLSGDVVIVMGMPPGSIFGFDTASFTLGDNSHHSEGIRGVRDIPPGPHFLYGGLSSELSTRNGFWIMSHPKEPGEHGKVFIKRWDSYSEALEDDISVAEVKIQTDNLPKVFNLLLPYGTSQRQQSLPAKSLGGKDQGMWSRLTFAIKDAMLMRITGQPLNRWHVSSSHEAKNMGVKPTDTKTNTILDLASDLVFVFPRTKVTFSSEVIGRARTEQALDTSAHIVSIIGDKCTYVDEVMYFYLRVNLGC